MGSVETDEKINESHNECMEIQQSPRFRDFTRELGWTVETIDGCNIFIRKFFLYGGMAKIQRTRSLPPVDRLLPILKSHSVRTVVAEADRHISPRAFAAWHKKLSSHVSITDEPYLPTKTRVVDLKPHLQEIHNQFTPAKRRGIKRALKNGVKIRRSNDIDELIAIKSRSAGLFGRITTYGLKKLWNHFQPKYAAILIAEAPKKTLFGEKTVTCGGVFLSMWDDTCYYWIAGSTGYGKRLHTATLLVWEAMQLAKDRGYERFDFLGVWDERLPAVHPEWKGFTKFKEGFGGEDVYYPLAKDSI